MPVYAFTCAGCGSFELTRPMEQAAAPAPCPTCGTEARRVVTPPGLAVLARPARRVLDMGEKRGHPLAHRHSPTPPWVLSH